MHADQGSATTLCKKCRKPTVSPTKIIKCIKCESVFHISCAKQNKSTKFIDENVLICCEGDIKVGQDTDTEF